MTTNKDVILKVEGEIFEEVYLGEDGCEVFFPHVSYLIAVVRKVFANTGDEAWVGMEPLMD